MGSADPRDKMDEILKSENMQKNSSFLNGGGENGAMLTTQIDILLNAPFRSQIFKILFASGGKGALIPLIKILWTFLHLISQMFERPLV